MIKTYYKTILVLICVAILFSGLAIFDVVRSKNFEWKNPEAIVIPFNGYYLDRMREIKDGNIFLGNPYFIEHNKEMAPAFFVADWINYIPMFFGLSVSYSIIFNLFFWSLIFLLLSFFIFISVGVNSRWATFGAILVYLVGYSLVIFPVSMQTIYPFYLIILLSLYLWIENPDNRKKQIFLAISLSLCFYIYTYLWQIALTTCLLTLFYLVMARKKSEAFILFKVLFLAFILSIPLFIFTYKQLNHPYYWETMQRIGLIQTRLPTAEFYYSCRWVILSLVLWFWLRFIKKDLSLNRNYNLLTTFFGLTGLALVIVSSSNFITGKELELSQHVVRFVKVWLAFSLVSYIYFVYINFKDFNSISAIKNIVGVSVLLLIVIYGFTMYLKDSTFGYVAQRIDYSEKIDDFEQIQSALKWLDDTESSPVVIMSDYRADINKYITTLSKNYILFSDAGILNLLPDKEAEERFILNGIINNISLNDIKRDYRLFAGHGNATNPYKTHNRKVRLCEIFIKVFSDYNCGILHNSFSYKGEDYFANLSRQYNDDIIPNINEKLKKFNVSYILLEKSAPVSPNLKKIKSIKEVYSNSGYVVYKIF